MRRLNLTSVVVTGLAGLLGGCVFGGSSDLPERGTGVDAGPDLVADTSTSDVDVLPDLPEQDVQNDLVSSIPLLLIVNSTDGEPFCDETICTLTGALELATIGFEEDQISRVITFEFDSETDIEILDPIDVVVPVEIVGSLETPVSLRANGLPAPALRLSADSLVESIAVLGAGDGVGIELKDSGANLFNVRVSGFASAVKVRGTDHVIDDCVLGDNPVNGFAPTDIALEIEGDAERILVQNNDIRRSNIGVLITPQTRVPNSMVEFVSNRVFRNQTGVRVHREDVDFVQNSFFGNQVVGVEIDVVAPVAAESIERDIAFEGNGFGGDKTAATLEGNGVGLSVIRAPAVRIGGIAQPGCAGTCNFFVDNRAESAFVRNVAYLRIQGNFVGTLPNGEPAPNELAFRVEYENLEPADFLIGRENVSDVSQCVGSCNVFGSGNSDALFLDGVPKGAVRGNQFGWVSASGVARISGTAIVMIDSQGAQIDSNFITASSRGIQVTGGSSDLARKGSIVGNLLGGSPNQPCGSVTDDDTLTTGILFNNGGAVGVGNWEIEDNDIRCVENIAIHIAESSMPAPVAISNNKLGLGQIGGSGIVISVPDATVSGNQIANVGGNGVVATGEFAQNILVDSNIFGAIDGVDIPTPVINNDGNAVGVFTGAHQIQISNNQIIGGYERGIRGANPNSTFVHFGNLYRQNLPRFVSLGGTDPVSSPDYESDQDIGVNTGLNAPIAAQAVLPLSGTVSANGGTVTAYRLLNAVWSEHPTANCQTTGVSFSCSGVLNGDLVKLVQTADLYQVDLVNFGNGDMCSPLTVRR